MVKFTWLLVLAIFALFGVCFGQSPNTQNIPACFVFGDSLLDPGNNNYLVSLSKANYPPNGIDFGEPTGRYTNGRTIVDIIGKSRIRVRRFIPPYLAPTTSGPIVLKGVNYASGGGGILDKSGQIFGGRLSLDAQINYFTNTREYILSSLSEESGFELLEKAVFVVVFGSNDFLNNYLVPVLSIVQRKLITPEQFVDSMIQKYELQITRLYNLGARKMVIVNVGPIGCIPYQRDLNPLAGDNCVELPNYMAKLFNAQLKTFVSQLIPTLEGSNLVYADSYLVVKDIIDNYQSYGFENSSSACCHVAGRFGGLIPCGPPSKVCSDRSKYVFWDPYHPSEASNVIIAKRFLDGDSSVIWPINVRQLFEA